jgi:hypothetical protein
MKTKPSMRISLTGIPALICFVLAGCQGTMQTVRVPIPVECREEVPDRPVMPTDRLHAGSGLDAFVQAITAEIERREGYELKLRTALEACTRPIEAR